MTFLRKFGQVVDDLMPFPGRGLLTLRIVVAVVFTTIMVMAFRMPVLGWLALYFCIATSRNGSASTYISCVAVVLLVIMAVFIGLLLLKFASDPDWLRLLWLTLILYIGFFVSRGMSDGDLMRDFTICLAIILTLPDVLPYPHLWERAALWILPITFAGTGSVVLATFLFPPERATPEGLPPEPLPQITMAKDWPKNPVYTFYAIKATLASMATYFVYSIVDLPLIHTALVTCLIVALPTTAAIVHKSWLRITGATTGAILAFWATVSIIPADEAFGALLLFLAFGSAIAAWVAVGSERIAYAGWQIGLAQFMMLTHGFGPSTDLTVLRDRLLGILLGNLMMALVFAVLWPDETKRLVKKTARPATVAVGLMAALFFLPGCQIGSGVAPPIPDRSWEPPDAADYRMPAAFREARVAAYDPGEVYRLPALIDLAQRNRPETRLAWERARAAAARVGVAASTFSPEVSLALLGAYERQDFPLPTDLFPKGRFSVDAAQFRPQVSVEWLLLDFGESAAAVEATRQMALAETFAFNAEHQAVVFEVTEAYYAVLETRAQERVAEAALEDALLLEEAAALGFRQGLVTEPELLRARQAVAQTRFDRSALRGDLQSARVRLAEAVGIDPSQPPRIADDLDESALPVLENGAGQLVDRALLQRPDLRARVAALRAAEAGIAEAEAGWWPVLSANANAGWVTNAFRVEDDSWIDPKTEPLYGAGIVFEWTVFEGDRRAAEIREARAEERKVQAELRKARNQAVREVWTAFIDFRNAREQVTSAAALLAAAEASHEATLASFENGLATLNEVQTAQADLTTARESLVSARLAVRASYAELRLAVGDSVG